MSPSSMIPTNVGTPDTLEINDRYDLASSSKNCNPNNSHVPQNKIGSLSNLNHFTLDAASQQFIDSMKYTDLILSVEPPGITNPIEIPCHKFMLAKKVSLLSIKV